MPANGNTAKVQELLATILHYYIGSADGKNLNITLYY